MSALAHTAPDHEMVWNVLIVDDEQNVRQVTALALSRVSFNGRPLRLHFADSAQSARELIRECPDLAVILLDLIMEHESSGIDLIRYVRDTLRNDRIRFVLRSGQAGLAPDSPAVRDYDIQEYWNKVDLTVTRLREVVLSAVGSYASLDREERS